MQGRLAFTLLFLLLGLPPLETIAHEGRVNPEQRRAIREQLHAQGCFDQLGNIVGVTVRGAVRGVTRGDQPPPPAAEAYSNYFAQVIPTELGLPYGQETDPQSHTFFSNDPHEGPQKIKVLRELGLPWTGNKAPSSAPNWMTLARNYQEALRTRGIDPATTFKPALVLYRDAGETIGKGGKKTKKRDYLFVDPLKDKFPEDMSQWKVLNKDVEFNIPFNPILAGMKQGKFPLLDAVHDISHFVSFLRFPEFAQAVAKQMKEIDPTNVTKGFKGREYWLTEAMSLPDPSGLPQNQKFLNENERPTQVRAVPEIEKELEKLSEKDLIQYSYKLAKHFESQLRDVSGGNSNAAEKWYYLSESFGMRAEDLLKEDLSRVNPTVPIMGLAKAYFENGPVTLDANPKALTNQTATFNFNTFVTAQKLLALSLKNGAEGDPATRKEALRTLAKFASRTEYLLTVKPFTYTEWAEAFLRPDLSREHPISRMLMTVFNNDIVSKNYLGTGAL